MVTQPSNCYIVCVIYTIQKVALLGYSPVNHIYFTLYSIHCTREQSTLFKLEINKSNVQFVKLNTIIPLYSLYTCTLHYTVHYLRQGSRVAWSSSEQSSQQLGRKVSSTRNLTVIIIIMNQKVQPATRAYFQLLQRASAFGRGFFCPSGKKRPYYAVLAHFCQQ